MLGTVGGVSALCRRGWCGLLASSVALAPLALHRARAVELDVEASAVSGVGVVGQSVLQFKLVSVRSAKRN